MIRPVELEMLADALTEWRLRLKRRYALGMVREFALMRRHQAYLGDRSQ